jgi:hypothetical protein
VVAVVYSFCDASDAFVIVHVRGGILGSGFKVPFVMALVLTGLGTALLVPEVGRAWHEYRLAKRGASRGLDTLRQ